MFRKIHLLLCVILVGHLVESQHQGKNTPEETLELPWEICKNGGGCIRQQGGVTIDGNWRWTHKVTD